jgi:anti-anti-sigma factor
MLKREDVESVTVLTHTEETSLCDPRPLKEMCAALVKEGRYRVILNLENVSSLTTMYLEGLVTVLKLFREHGGTLKLLHLQPAVSSIMHLTRLSRIIEIFNDRDTAVKSFPS